MHQLLLYRKLHATELERDVDLHIARNKPHLPCGIVLRALYTSIDSIGYLARNLRESKAGDHSSAIAEG